MLDLHKRTATLQTGATTTGDGSPMDVQGQSVCTMDVQISDTATVTFEATLDGDTWYAVRALALSTGVVATATSASGLWTLPLTGVKYVRARVSAHTGGTVTVKGVATREPGGLGALVA